ncbi:MAG: hypothetical protein A2V85_15930 [Chloroflexi bacterium RBG_16_72_14]|nr:MAG: hypothetical protein A2V85_15930 [Chloroflexi bacterium RBG_16_72_14]
MTHQPAGSWAARIGAIGGLSMASARAAATSGSSTGRSSSHRSASWRTAGPDPRSSDGRGSARSAVSQPSPIPRLT